MKRVLLYLSPSNLEPQQHAHLATYDIEVIHIAEWEQRHVYHAILIDGRQGIDETWFEHINQHVSLSFLDQLVLVENNAQAKAAALQLNVSGVVTAPLHAGELHAMLKLLERSLMVGDPQILSHDLKSPLGSAITSMGLIAELLDDPQLDTLVHDVLNLAYMQNDIIDNYIDVFLLAAGKVSAQPQVVSMHSLDVALQEDILPRVNTKGVVVQVLIRVDLPDVYIDYKLMLRIWRALLYNCIKFCRSTDKLHIQARVADGFVEIEILDTGRPILKEVGEGIFDPAYQFAARMAGSRTSVGFNLPFGRAALRLMGGEVAIAEPTEIGWTGFVMRLPQAV